MSVMTHMVHSLTSAGKTNGGEMETEGHLPWVEVLLCCSVLDTDRGTAIAEFLFKHACARTLTHTHTLAYVKFSGTCSNKGCKNKDTKKKTRHKKKIKLRN